VVGKIDLKKSRKRKDGEEKKKKEKQNKKKREGNKEKKWTASRNRVIINQ